MYRFFEVNLLIFFALMPINDESVAAGVGRAYFVWLSVFNQFVISMMWTAFAEAYRSKQAKRWFGLISAGGTLGGIIGSIVAGFISSRLDVSFVLLIGVLVLEWCLWRGNRFQQSTTIRNQDALQGPPQTESQSHHPSDDTTNHDVEPKPTARRRIWSGVVAIARTPYLLGIAGFLLTIKACATTVYCQQGDVVAQAALSESERVQLFASINTWVLGMTLAVQLFGTGALMRRWSMRWVLLIFPAIYVVGFGLLATMPSLHVVIGLVVIHRAASYAVIAPAVEVLFTVVDSQTLYRVKGIVDTVVIRGGDVISAQAYGALRAASISLTGIAWLFVPIAIIARLAGASLGSAQRRRQSRQEPVPIA